VEEIEYLVIVGWIYSPLPIELEGRLHVVQSKDLGGVSAECLELNSAPKQKL